MAEDEIGNKSIEKDKKRILFDTDDNATAVEQGTLLGNMDAQRGEILKIFGKSEENGVDTDTQVLDAILEYLEEKGVIEIETLNFSQYDKGELDNRDIIFEDERLALTLDELDEEEGIKIHCAWIKI